jgi:hypothetical protein
MKDSLGKGLAIVFLILIIGSMTLTTVAPDLINRQPSSSQTVQEGPTTATASTPAPAVFPTPNPNGPDVTLEAAYVHPSGIFYIAQPQGFVPTPTTQSNIASVSMVDTARYSVVHAYVQQYTAPQDITALDVENSPSVLAASWVQYDNWVETGRTQEEDRLVIDFDLALGQNDYLGRHITWPAPEDSTWVYVLRLVVPANYPALLDALETLIIPSYHLLADSLSVPLEWGAVIDPSAGYTIRYPETWTFLDGGTGRITTLTGEGTLTLSGGMEPVVDEEAARAWVLASRSEAEIVAVEPIERPYGAGYAVAYGFADSDGEPQSGLVLLLNGAGDRLVTANLRLPTGGVNLLADAGEHADLQAMLATFDVLPADALQPAVE